MASGAVFVTDILKIAVNYNSVRYIIYQIKYLHLIIHCIYAGRRLRIVRLTKLIDVLKHLNIYYGSN